MLDDLALGKSLKPYSKRKSVINVLFLEILFFLASFRLRLYLQLVAWLSLSYFKKNLNKINFFNDSIENITNPHSKTFFINWQLTGVSFVTYSYIMKDFLIPSQVAKHLKKSKVTIIRWIHKGTFEDVRKVGGEFRIPLVSFNKYVESTKFKPTKKKEKTNG